MEVCRNRPGHSDGQGLLPGFGAFVDAQVGWNGQGFATAGWAAQGPVGVLPCSVAGQERSITRMLPLSLSLSWRQLCLPLFLSHTLTVHVCVCVRLSAPVLLSFSCLNCSSL